jgi:predicted RNA methylase
VGAGTGILSFLAEEAGASSVYAIERAEIFKDLKKRIKSKGLEKVIKAVNI